MIMMMMIMKMSKFFEFRSERTEGKGSLLDLVMYGSILKKILIKWVLRKRDEIH